MSGRLKPYPKNSSMSDKRDWVKHEFVPHFETMVINPARDITTHPNGAMPAFLWITCAIDWLARFMHGKERTPQIRGIVHDTYVKFIQDHFPSGYHNHAEGIYNLRNGFVHSYTIKERRQTKKREYSLTHRGLDGKHFDLLPDGKTLLNLDDLLKDFEAAAAKYFREVETNSIGLQNFIECYEREGFLQVT